MTAESPYLHKHALTSEEILAGFAVPSTDTAQESIDFLLKKANKGGKGGPTDQYDLARGKQGWSGAGVYDKKWRYERREKRQ